MILLTQVSLKAQSNIYNNMAFKMKGFSGFKQTSYESFDKAIEKKSDADNILKDPTMEGAGTIHGGIQVMKETKADRISNFADSVENLAGKAKEGHEARKAQATSATKGDERKEAAQEPETNAQSEAVEEPKPEALGFMDSGGSADTKPKIQLDDETKGKITEAGSKWASDIVGGFFG